MSKGFLIFAQNNEEIDYVKMAMCSSLMAKHHSPDARTCLVTNQASIDATNAAHDKSLISSAFDDIVVIDNQNSTKRRFSDAAHSYSTLSWHNLARSMAYELSPYDETILLDSDFLVQNNFLDLCWGSQDDLMINHQATNLLGQKPDNRDVYLNKSGIRMYWATIVYFRKSDQARELFELVSYVKENFRDYQHLYEFPGSLFRNDYAFSIAIHILNGQQETNQISSLPFPVIPSSFDCDDLLDVEKDKMTFLVEDWSNKSNYILTTTHRTSVHCMNKYALLRMSDKIIQTYQNTK